MANLGNLWFTLGLKDEEANKVLDRIEQRLQGDNFKIKIKAANAQEFLRDLKEQLKGEALSINVKPLSLGTTGARTTAADVRYARMMEVQQRAANANAMAQQRLQDARDRAARAAERHARATANMGRELNSSNKGVNAQVRLLHQVRNQLLDIYSIYKAEQFLRSLVQIGGEFQKQHIALRAILGDVSKADAMFANIKELAIESPFNFRDLMGFTKQIAAFGIPYEEMYETTKRLADISAGLGVDMGRIILAFGQVRSAAVLRGQELRQFTEAGIPLVDELAKKFSELEGRVVSAGEVFEKISNREVSFGMVKDILWQMTNEGGRFYNMQEQLTQSLSGKLAKLQDSWEMMLGSIAESNNDIIGGTIDSLTNLTNKWESVISVIKSVIAAYGVYKGVMLVANTIRVAAVAKEVALTGAITSQTVALYRKTAAMKLADKGAASLLYSWTKLKEGVGSLGAWGAWAIALAAVAAIGTGIYNAYQNSQKLSRELDKVFASANSQWREGKKDMTQLVEKLNGLVKGTQEYDETIDLIQSKYGEYLGNLKKEEYSYESLKGKIESVTQALKNKAREEARQQARAAISEEFSDDISSKTSGLESIIHAYTGASKGVAKAVVVAFKEAFDKELEINDNPNGVDIISKILETYGLKLRGGHIAVNALGDVLKEVYNTTKDFNKTLDEISTSSAEKTLEEIQKKRDELAKKTVFKSDREREDFTLETLRMQLEAIKDIEGSSELQRGLEAKINTIIRFRDEWIQTANQIANGIGVKKLGNLLPDSNDKGKFSLSSYVDRLRKAYEDISKSLDNAKANQSKFSTKEDRYRKEQLEAQKLYIKTLFATYGVELEIEKKRKKKNSKSEAEKAALKAFKAELKAIQESIDDIVSKWKVFSSVLEKTGNKNFAKTLAFGSLSVGESGVMKELRKKIEEGLKGSKTTFDGFLSLNNAEIEKMGKPFQLLKPYADAYKKAQRELRKETADNLTELVVKYKDYAAKVADVERRKNKDIADIQSNAARLRKDGINPDRLIAERNKQAEKEKTSVLFDQFKESSNWVKIFDDLDRVSDATLDNMIKQVEAFAGGMAEGAEETKEVIDALRKLRDEQIQRNPWRGMIDAFSRLNMWKSRENQTYMKLDPNTGKMVSHKLYSKEQIEDGKAEALNNLEKSVNGVIDGLDGMVKSLELVSNTLDSLGLGSLSDFTGILGSGLSGATSMGGGLSKFGSLLGLSGAAIKNMGFIGMGIGAVSGIIGSIAQLHDKKLDKAIQRSQRRVEGLKNAYDMIEDSINRGVGTLEQGVYNVSQLKTQAELAGTSLSESFLKPFSVLKDGGRKYISDLKNEILKGFSFSSVYGAKNFSHNKWLNREMLFDLEAAGVGKNNLTNEELKKREAQYVALVEQRKELQTQMRDEEKKKKTDHGKVADYQNQISELNVQIKTFVEDLAKDLFGIDFDGWAGQISDALVEAFANGEDAAESFKNVTNSILRGVANSVLKNMVIKPMFEKLQQKLFGGKDGKGGIFETFEDLEKNGAKLTEVLQEFFKGEGQQMIDASQQFLESLDKASGGAISATGDKDKNKGGLSAGIQSVTEDTANLLASYLNAIRASTSIIQGILERTNPGDNMQMSAIAQAQLQQLSIIATNTGRNVEFVEEIRDILHRNVNGGNKFNI